jgi:hypothetical protein
MNTVQDIAARIHGSPQQAVMVVSGAGSQAIAWLLGVAGASRTVLEGLVPYGTESMLDFLGFEPEQFVSEDTARSMARAAFRRARRLGGKDVPLLGLGCTATIATDRLKRGEHRCYVAIWDDSQWTAYNLHLDKGRRDRAGEEEVVSKLVLQAMARACGVKEDLDLGLTAADVIETRRRSHPNPLEWLLSGEAGTVTVSPDGRIAVDEPVRAALLPGSFNPLHQGHEALAQAASEILGTEVIFEMSVTNVDKPPLTIEEVRHRLSQFQDKATVVLTRADTYHKKAALFPGCTFIIGWDTAVRLVAPGYYGGDESAMVTALVEIWGLGCRFWVAGRETDGKYRTLSDVAVPQGFGWLFRSIPESAFRVDISSTALRARS